MAFLLTSPNFTTGGLLPTEYTCEGPGKSPELDWMGAPEDTQSYALIVHDPDAPKGDFTHWLLYDIPAGVQSLPEQVTPGTFGIAGTNSFGSQTYGPACPPPGDKPHHYLFELYALNVDRTGLPEGAHREQVEAAMREHVLNTARLEAVYQRGGHK